MLALNSATLSGYASLLAPAWAAAALLMLWSAPLGSVVLWRRMAFFADTLAHGALLGLGVAALLSVPLWLGVVAIALVLVIVLAVMYDRRIPTDALLATLASGLLCGGVILVSLQPSLRPVLMGYLFGDLLAVTWPQVGGIALGVLVGLAVLALRWRQQVACAANTDLAKVQGIRINLEYALLLVLLASFTILAMKAVGTLLVGSLLITPALSARLLSRSPTAMALWALGIGQLGVVLGLLASVALNWVTGPTLVLALVLEFVAIWLVTRLLRR